MASRSISKRENGRWRGRYRDSAGKEHARHFTRKIDAQQWLDEVTASVVTGQYVDPAAGKITFAQWWADWSARQVWAAGTATSADQAADSVTFADVPIKIIRRSHVEAWVKVMSLPAESRRGSLAASTIRTRYNYVHAAFVAAVKDRVIPHDPAAGVSLPKTRRQAVAMTIPTPDEVRLALSKAPARFGPFVALCAFAGLRLGEAAGVQVGDVDFLRRVVKVRRQIQGQTAQNATIVPPKAGSERDVPVPAALVGLLAEHIATVGTFGDEGWLFGRDTSTRLNRNSAGNAWRLTRKAAGLSEGFTLHSLRHFYASALIAAGCDVVTVQRALGHSSASITLNTYSHLWPTGEDRTRKAAASLMAEVLGGADCVRTASTEGLAD